MRLATRGIERDCLGVCIKRPTSAPGPQDEERRSSGTIQLRVFAEFLRAAGGCGLISALVLLFGLQPVLYAI